MRASRLVPLLALALAACGGGVSTVTPTPAPGASGTPGTTASVAPSPAPTATGAPTPVPSAAPTPAPAPTIPAVCLPQHGGSASFAAVRDLRVGTHAGYDRLVVEFDGPVPAWTMAANGGMVFTGGGRGEPMTLAGAYGVRLDIQHVDWTHGAYPHGTDLVPGYAVLREVRVVGNFEGVLNLGVGLSRQACPAVSVLSGPPRLVVDFPTT